MHYFYFMPKLFMLLIGCSPAGRHTEQHDVFFSIGDNIRDVLPQAKNFWPEAKNTLHLDAWREVTVLDGFAVHVSETAVTSDTQLFFINLGGYKPGEFEEFHYKMLVPAVDKGEAVKKSKQTAFFKHTGFKGANAHIDDKYGVDVDDIHAIRDILPADIKERFSLAIVPAPGDAEEDILHLGYFRPDNVDRWAPL
jgi:hypothetical protein